MYNILRYIRQNGNKIIGIFLFIIFVYSIVHVADNSYKVKQKPDQEISKNDVIIQTNETIKLTDRNCRETIEKFLKNCTKGNYEEAYSYLSDECKKNKYSDVQDFIKNYCDTNDIKGKGYSINKSDNSKYQYKIIFNDMLSTGKTNSTKTVAYYTITVDNGEDIRISID